MEQNIKWMNVPNGTARVGKTRNNQTSSYKLQENIRMQDTSMIMSVWFCTNTTAKRILDRLEI